MSGLPGGSMAPRGRRNDHDVMTHMFVEDMPSGGIGDPQGDLRGSGFPHVHSCRARSIADRGEGSGWRFSTVLWRSVSEVLSAAIAGGNPKRGRHPDASSTVINEYQTARYIMSNSTQSQSRLFRHIAFVARAKSFAEAIRTPTPITARALSSKRRDESRRELLQR